MAKPLVIVESPAKAKTISRFLGSDFLVEPSIGHIRDLPRNASEVPAAYKSQPWSRIGVDTDNGFKPLYIVSKEKKNQVKKLKELLASASELYLATDEDREGESIAWHLLEVLSPKVPVKRMVFHEITEGAIHDAISNPRDLDRNLVEAQEARRILDRLYGYEISPVLWRKVQQGLSAGRVQSVACRILVQRERERIAFRSASYFDVVANLSKQKEAFDAKLTMVNSKRVATGRDFGPDGDLLKKSSKSDTVVIDQEMSSALIGALEGSDFSVSETETKPYKRSPAAPFITSTLQQEAGRKLRFSSQRTMSVAQRLYENGYITYMRTDSTNLAEVAVSEARRIATTLYGPSYVPSSPRSYTKKVKNAQEAHEAIRPSGDSWRTPEELAKELGSDEIKLYELIWRRTVASQMKDAVGSTATVKMTAPLKTDFHSQRGDNYAGFSSGEPATFSSSGTQITFFGFLKVYVEDSDEPVEKDASSARLPMLEVGDRLELLGLNSESHETQPPSRYTEASLVKALEELGVGRPSTYASIIQTIMDRGYAWRKGQALVPSYVAFSVVGLLEKYFSTLVDFGFTASLEDDLDQIADGNLTTGDYLSHFYFGDGSNGLKNLVQDQLSEIDAREINTLEVGVAENGETIYARIGKFGTYLKVGEETAPVPDDLAPDELTVEKAMELLSSKKQDREVGIDPKTGFLVIAKAGRFGPYVQLQDPDPDSKAKAKTASLFSDMSIETITLSEALELLELPRVVGQDPETKEEIVAQNGRFGPYLTKGKESRSLSEERSLFTVTLEEALELFSKPKENRRQRAQAQPANILGVSPVTEKDVALKAGRFGPYVTDGSVNASIPRGTNPETLSLEAALDLLEIRRAKLAETAGDEKPKPRRSTGRSSAKRTTTKRRT